MALPRRYELHLDSHGEAISNCRLPFARLNVLSYTRPIGRPLIVANTSGLPWQVTSERTAVARLFPGHDVVFLSIQTGSRAPVNLWFGTVSAVGDDDVVVVVVESKTPPGHALIGAMWYMLGRDLVPARLPRIVLNRCRRLAPRMAFAVSVCGGGGGKMKAVTIPQRGHVDDEGIVTVLEPGWSCGFVSHFDARAFARALGIRPGDLGFEITERKTLLKTDNDKEEEEEEDMFRTRVREDLIIAQESMESPDVIPAYVVVPVLSVAALDRVVLDAARLRAELADVGGSLASYMYIFTPLPEDDPADVDTYHAKLFNLTTLEEEYPTGVEATLIVRYQSKWGKPFPTAPKWTVYHPGRASDGRRACIVSLFPTEHGDSSHFGGAAVTTGEGEVELKFSHLTGRKSVDSGIGAEMDVDAGPEVADLSGHLTSEHEGLHDLGHLKEEDEWETASQTDLETLDSLLDSH